MGFLLTLVYVAISILSPAELFPDLAPYRIMIWIALLAVAASAPNIFRSAWLRLPHAYLMLGVLLAICVSRALNGSVGGAASSLASFLPVAIIFFLLIWNVTTVSQIRILAAVLISIALYSIACGAVAYYTGNDQSAYVVNQPVWINENLGLRRNYLRIRALGFLNDPNDFAQYLLMLLPFLFPVWQRARALGKTLFCLLPALAILFGIYLTNSRGALIGLALLVLVAIKERIGGKRALLLAPLAAGAILVLNHGGRSIDVHEDSALGRVNAWSDGLGMFEHSPLWGVGFGEFTKYHEITAHNSYVLCMSELGLIGCVAWVGLLVATVLQLRLVGCCASDEVADEETQQWAAVLRPSLYATLATCWFLSRTYSATLYLLLGITVALCIQDVASETEELPKAHWLRVTLAAVPLLTVAVYGTVRMRSF